MTFFQAVNATSFDVLLDLAELRPSLIPMLPDRTLRVFIVQPDFVKRLSHGTLEYLIHSPSMGERLAALPRSTIAMIVSFHPVILTLLPRDRRYPARALVEELMMDRDFLRRIPIEIHAWLGESEFRHQLTPPAVRTILSVYPELPKYLSDLGLKANHEHFHSQAFLSSLPCTIYMTLANDLTFVNRLTSDDIRALAKNRKMWSCLPVKTVRRLVGHSEVGRHLDLRQIVTAASTMGVKKSLDWNVLGNLVRYQLPGLWIRQTEYFTSR